MHIGHLQSIFKHHTFTDKRWKRLFSANGVFFVDAFDEIIQYFVVVVFSF